MSLESRIEQRCLEVEARLSGMPATVKQNIEKSAVTRVRKSYIDERVERYQKALEEALRYAPCSGCKNLVLSALTGLYIFRAMELTGRSRAEIPKQEIEKIKEEVERRYQNY